MPPRLVVCSCDPVWTALAVCDVCEHRHLEVVLEHQGKVAREHPVNEAFDALARSYYLDGADSSDRLWSEQS